MQFEKFTERARKVVDLASEEANRMGSDSVGTVHLLLGMLREGKGVAGNVLADNDIDVDAVLEAYQSIGDESDATLDDVESRCLIEAEWFNHNYVGTEHLLLGVCCLVDGKAFKLLTNMSKRPVDLCKDVVELIGYGPEWQRWLTEHPDLQESH